MDETQRKPDAAPAEPAKPKAAEDTRTPAQLLDAIDETARRLAGNRAVAIEHLTALLRRKLAP